LITEERIACDYERTGHIQAASKAAHFDAFRDEQALLARVFDHRVELVSRADQRSEVGTEIYHGLLVDERSAALNPARYVEGLAPASNTLDALQTAFLETGGAQCGICTPGMLMAGRAYLDAGGGPDDDAIREAIAGNLCRCTGYTKIVEAIARAASQGSSQ